MNPFKRHPIIQIATVLVYIFLYAPIIVLILYSFNASRANVTFEGFIPKFSERVVMDGSLVKSSPCGAFHWFCELSKNRDVMDAAGNTLTIAFTSTIISTIIGTMAALALQRYEFKLKPFSQLSLYIPIVIPEIVMGIGMLRNQGSEVEGTGGFVLLLVAATWSEPSRASVGPGDSLGGRQRYARRRAICALRRQ